MDIDTILDQLKEANKHHDEARRQMAQARTKQARREAEEDLNFWQGMVAYLEGWIQNTPEVMEARAMLPIQMRAFKIMNPKER